LSVQIQQRTSVLQDTISANVFTLMTDQYVQITLLSILNNVLVRFSFNIRVTVPVLGDEVLIHAQIGRNAGLAGAATWGNITTLKARATNDYHRETITIEIIDSPSVSGVITYQLRLAAETPIGGGAGGSATVNSIATANADSMSTYTAEEITP
jgi:hypothetical protein